MGTRNLICVFLDGEYKVAQYSQFDGYPEGNGLDCLHFLNHLYDEKCPPELYEMFRNLSWFTQEELDEIYGLLGVDESGWLTTDQSKRLRKYHPELSRDTGAAILPLIFKTNGNIKLVNNVDFAASDDCEWAWVIDFDKDTFEAYEGYNKWPLTPEDRFYSDHDKEKHRYYGVKLVKSWPLPGVGHLPSDEEFLAAFKRGDE